jgi:hypothetical protein
LNSTTQPFNKNMILNPDLGKQPIKYELKPYESPQPTVIPRGEFYGPSPSLLDIAFLKSLLDITDRVDRATVTPHASILHRYYSELSSAIDAAAPSSLDEVSWAREMLRVLESSSSRRRVAGAPSAVQFRGSGDFWGAVRTQLRRRAAEKALCKVRELGGIPRASAARRTRCLEELAACLALDHELQARR